MPEDELPRKKYINGKSAGQAAYIAGVAIAVSIVFNFLDLERQSTSGDISDLKDTIAELKVSLISHDEEKWHSGAGEAISSTNSEVSGLKERVSSHFSDKGDHGDRFTNSDWKREKQHFKYRFDRNEALLKDFETRLRDLEIGD